MLRLFLLAAVALVCSASQDPQGAWLLASKMPLSNSGVEGKDYVVQYGLYNVGDRPATKITLDDRNSFPSQYFEVISGMLQVNLERLNPEDNFTHVAIVRPMQAGLFNFTAAQITYRPDVASNEIRTGLTTAPGEAYIYRAVDYERRFGSKYQYFAVFFLVIGTPTLGSLFVYLNSARKYEIEEPTTPTKTAPTKSTTTKKNKSN